MKKPFRRIVQYLFALFGFDYQRLSDVESVKQLIKSLKPYNTNVKLIRLGPNGDGGYLVPDDLAGIKACFSPGVSNISGFEEDCARLGMQIFMADKTVEKPNIKLSPEKYHFLKKFIGHFNDDDFIEIEEWLKTAQLNQHDDLMLQMDIEGCEYFTFINIPQSSLSRFRIIVVEFHNLDRLWNRDFFKLASAAFEKILKTHTCVHIHPNNCYGVNKHKGIEIPVLAEFSFFRNDRISEKIPKTLFPDPLDFDNTTAKHIVLPKNWFLES
ncbi:MAG TPA: hypothetical protein PLM49_00110 [Bacteroidales bacterium]|nr:hypothetical protein [Bacteroidales bacterium]